jgi:hypothetical protein
MRQAIHIFRKDACALWPQILATQAAAAAITWKQVADAADPSHVDSFLFLLAVSRWYLIVCAVHQEKLAGNRQWWITRPYSWKSLLAAKALLVAVFVHLPSLASDAAILLSQGLSLQSGWRNLLMRQVALALVYLLPGAAMAAVTEGLVSFGLAGLSMFLLVVVVPMMSDRSPVVGWGPLMWLPLTVAVLVLAATAASALVWQYGRRRTTAGRGLLGVGAVLSMSAMIAPPAAWGIGIQTRLLRAPRDTERIRLQSVGDLSIVKARGADRNRRLQLKVSFAGIPPGMVVQPDLIDLEIETRDGSHWHAGWRWVYSAWAWEGQNARVEFAVPRSYLDRVRAHDVTVRLLAALTMLGPERTQTMDPRRGDVAVEGVGLCGVTRAPGQGYSVRCKSGSPPAEEISIIETGYHYSRPGEWAHWLAFGPSPVWTTQILWQNVSNEGPITFRMRKPVAHLERDLVLERVRLANVGEQ